MKNLKLRILSIALSIALTSQAFAAPVYAPVLLTQFTAAEYVGSETIHQTQTDGSFGITVPSGTELIVLTTAGFNGVNDNLYSKLNFDNGATIDLSTAAAEIWSTGGSRQIQVDTIATGSADWPGIGTATLYYGNSLSYGEGYQMLVSYFGGVGATPIGDTDSTTSTDIWSSSLTGVGADDLGVIACYGYAATPDIDPATYGQTAIIESTPYNSAALSVGYELGEGALRAEETGSSAEVCVAFAVNGG